jgi:hypothetical protein
MWKYISVALFLICQFHGYSQTVSENLIAGSWYVVRWETTDRLLDFEDSVASIRYMVENFKQKNKVLIVQKADSVRLWQELRRIMSVAESLRFRLFLNKDKSFIWTGNNNTNAQYKGTYALAGNKEQIVLTSFDGATKAYRTMPLRLHALQPNHMIIEIPSEEPGIKQSKFTLKRL